MITPLNIALFGALAACVAGGAGFAYGVQVGEAQQKAAQKMRNDVIEIQSRELQKTIDAAAQHYQAGELARQALVREIYHKSQKIVDRPVYRTVCIDLDGVSLLDSAASTANGSGLAQPADPAAAIAESAADE